MMVFIKLYVITLVIFLGIDFLWIGGFAKNLYKEQIGSILAEKINWPAALLFYALYVAGLLFFAVMPAIQEQKWHIAVFYGCFLGLIAYACYDLTNLALLKKWPLYVAVTDILWGTFLSGLTSVITYHISNYWKV